MDKKIICKEGMCPYCGSKDIEYGAIEFEDFDAYYYPCHCKSCNKNYEEWHESIFSGVVLTDENGLTIERDKEIPEGVASRLLKKMNFLEERGYSRTSDDDNIVYCSYQSPGAYATINLTYNSFKLELNSIEKQSDIDKIQIIFNNLRRDFEEIQKM